jgi:hypothetical protein
MKDEGSERDILLRQQVKLQHKSAGIAKISGRLTLEGSAAGISAKKHDTAKRL